MKWKCLSFGPDVGSDKRKYFFEEYSKANFKQRKYVTAKKGKYVVGEVVENP